MRLSRLCAPVLVVCALALPACASSTNDASVSQQQVESKLAKDAQITQVRTSIGAAKFTTYVACIAKALKKDAKGSDLDAYVNGRKSLDAIGGNAGAAKTDAAKCTDTALGK